MIRQADEQDEPERTTDMDEQLRAGAARLDITPRTPIDLVGYSRRCDPAPGVRHRLTAGALALDDGQTRLAIIALDILALRPAQADELRKKVAEAIGTGPDCVMLNVSHTHGGPQSHRGGVKIGGDQRGLSANELDFIDSLPERIVAVAEEAAGRLEPARAGAGSGRLELGVNRRERASDGRTILGWNPDKDWDREVGVLRLDRPDGTPLAVVVNFACHPVVVGPEDPAINADFPGPMRDAVEDFYQESGAMALFLQGAGGDVLPLEGFFDHPGPEDAFGKRLALEAIHAAADIETHPTTVEKTGYGSVTPISLYRRRRAPDPPRQRLAAAGREVMLPLKKVPAIADVEEELDGYRAALGEAEEAGWGRERLNPLEYHVNWAEEALRQLKDGWEAPAVPAYIQAFRIGDIGVAAVPGEVFSGIARQIKSRSPAAATLFAGYANGVLSYLPTADEYPYGGYECDYAHHSYGLVEQVAPESEAILVNGCLDLLTALWS